LSRNNSITAPAERSKQYNSPTASSTNLKLIALNAHNHSSNAIDRAKQWRHSKLAADKHKQFEFELHKLLRLVHIRL
jgi:hypothetical protein